MSTIKASNIQNGSSASTNIVLNTDGSATFAQMPVGPSYFAMRNKIINGAMEIDQRNAGASVTPTNGQYLVDRFYATATQASKFTAQQNAGSIAPPSKFIKYLGLTVAAAANVSLGAGDLFTVAQQIEGLNAIDLGWGTASASSVTLSFWVRSSVTGTHAGNLQNYTQTQSYVFTYTISAANTWEYKTITISGPTSGTWATDNTSFAYVRFNLGAGTTYQTATTNAWVSGNYWSTSGAVTPITTNSATFYLTGCQLEVGNVATPYERRLISQELAMCYRYYRRYLNGGTTYTAIGSGLSQGASSISRWGFQLDIPMRATPTFSIVNSVGWNGPVGGAVSAANNLCSPNIIDCDLNTSGLNATVGFIAKVLMLSTGYVEVSSEL
jgi:hypothetical protein